MLSEVLEQADLKYTEVGQNSYLLPFGGRHLPSIPVQARVFDEGGERVIGLAAPLAGVRDDGFVQPLLRLTVEMDGLKMGRHPGDGSAFVIAEAPADLVDPGLLRRLAELVSAVADRPAACFRQADGQREVMAMTRGLLRPLTGPAVDLQAAAGIAGWPATPTPDPGVLRVETGGLNLVLRRQGGILGVYAFTDTHPGPAVQGLMLAANMVSRLVKTGLDSDGDLAFLIEIPTPRSEMDVVNAVNRLAQAVRVQWPALEMAQLGQGSRGRASWLAGLLGR